MVILYSCSDLYIEEPKKKNVEKGDEIDTRGSERGPRSAVGVKAVLELNGSKSAANGGEIVPDKRGL